MNKEFQSFRLNESGIKKADLITGIFDIILDELKKHCPESREFSLCRTKLEMASFYAKKAVALDETNQEKV